MITDFGRRTGSAVESHRVSAPDVSVVVAAYNTMPYLTTCLNSLVDQSIGRDRMQIVAIDDGSTDNTGRELERFARRYPQTMTVLHQANSGGPAAPSNRGLEHATGRYVFFVGADDYLGREALERLVKAADADGSDVILGRMVGVNSRYVHQEIFASDQTDVDLFDSALPYSLSNTKLFRRELIERHKLRFPEHMPVCSDQPFTLEACLRAKRISVLADYNYYYAVRRLNSRNITYHSRHTERLASTAALMAAVAELIEPGPRRDAIHVRHFSWELSKLLEDDFLTLDRSTQLQVHAGIAALADEYLTDAIVARLPVETRLRLTIAQHGELDHLTAMIRRDARHGVPPTVIEDGRRFAAYPGFRDDRAGLADRWFDVTDVAAGWAAKVDAIGVRLRHEAGERVLSITARSPDPDLAADARLVRVSAGGLVAETAAVPEPGGGSTLVRASFRINDLIAQTAPLGGRLNLRTLVEVDGGTGTAPMRAPQLPKPSPLISRFGRRAYAVTITRDHSGHLLIAVTPVTLRRVLARLRRTWAQGGK